MLRVARPPFGRAERSIPIVPIRIRSHRDPSLRGRGGRSLRMTPQIPSKVTELTLGVLALASQSEFSALWTRLQPVGDSPETFFEPRQHQAEKGFLGLYSGCAQGF